MSIRILMAALSILVLICACSAPGGLGVPIASSSPPMFGERPRAALDGEPRRIDHLVRGYIRADEVEPSGFGFYAYLVFADESRGTLQRRLAAAKAFLGLFQGADLLNPNSLPTRKHRAILLAPLKADTPAPSNPEELVERYDYERGFALWRDQRRAGRRTASVSVLGSPKSFGSETAGSEVHIVELCGIADMEPKLRGFRDQLVFGDDEASLAEFSILEKLRSSFRALGGFVLASARADTSDLGRCD